MNKKLLRPEDAYLLAFLIPVMSMLVIFYAKNIYPCGGGTFLRTDMYHQYAPFFSELQYKLKNGGSLLYSWDVGLGINFTALYAYYLASPLNFLVVLLPKTLVIEFMTYMIVLKIGLSGLTSAIYFRRHYRKLNVGCAIFGVLYAMSGYVAAYSWNLMWLDCILLFPLVMLGLERLVKGESPVMYVLTLGLCILSNYYISIMICLFMVIWFLCQQVLQTMSWKERGRSCLRFGLCSLLAGGLAAILLLPELCALQGTASANSSFPDTVKQYFTIVDMMARQMPLVETEQGLDHWPNIYCGAMVFLMLPLYFMNREIPLRRKAVYGALLILFYLSFSLNVLNFIWHGFHYPNSLPCRQGFIYVFLLLAMCYEAYLHRKAVSGQQLGMALGLGCLFILLCQKLITDDAFEWYTFYVSLGLVLLYGLFFYMEQHRRWGYNVLLFALLFTVSIESLVNMAVTSVTVTSRDSYTEDNADVEALVSRVQQEDQSFYRFEKMSRKTKNDGAFMHFPSVSIFSSMAYKSCSELFELLGCEASTNAYSINGSTPLVNMLLSVKYSLYSQEPTAAEARGQYYVDMQGETYLYGTDYSLPLGYLLTEEELNAFDTKAGTPALVQNSLCESLGTSPVLETVLGDFSDSDYSFTVETAGDYYVYVNNKKVKEVKASSDSMEKSFDNVDRGYFLELGWLEAGETVKLSSETSGQKIDCDVYRFDYEALSEVYNVLSESGLTLTKWTDTEVEGTVQAEEDGILMTSIPYDEGWTVYVDGSAVKPEKVKDTFLGISLTAGEHSIRLSFFPKGLKAGMAISGVSLLLFIFLFLWSRKESKKKRMKRSAGRKAREERQSAAEAEGKTEFLPPLDAAYGNGGPLLGPEPELPNIGKSRAKQMRGKRQPEGTKEAEVLQLRPREAVKETLLLQETGAVTGISLSENETEAETADETAAQEAITEPAVKESDAEELDLIDLEEEEKK